MCRASSTQAMRKGKSDLTPAKFFAFSQSLRGFDDESCSSFFTSGSQNYIGWDLAIHLPIQTNKFLFADILLVRKQQCTQHNFSCLKIWKKDFLYNVEMIHTKRSKMIAHIFHRCKQVKIACMKGKYISVENVYKMVF